MGQPPRQCCGAGTSLHWGWGKGWGPPIPTGRAPSTGGGGPRHCPGRAVPGRGAPEPPPAGGVPAPPGCMTSSFRPGFLPAAAAAAADRLPARRGAARPARPRHVAGAALRRGQGGSLRRRARGGGAALQLPPAGHQRLLRGQPGQAAPQAGTDRPRQERYRPTPSPLPAPTPASAPRHRRRCPTASLGPPHLPCGIPGTGSCIPSAAPQHPPDPRICPCIPGSAPRHSRDPRICLSIPGCAPGPLDLPYSFPDAAPRHPLYWPWHPQAPTHSILRTLDSALTSPLLAGAFLALPPQHHRHCPTTSLGLPDLPCIPALSPGTPGTVPQHPRLCPPISPTLLLATPEFPALPHIICGTAPQHLWDTQVCNWHPALP